MYLSITEKRPTLHLLFSSTGQISQSVWCCGSHQPCFSLESTSDLSVEKGDPSVSHFEFQLIVQRFHHASLISQLRRKTGMSTPLLPKWQRPSTSTGPTVTTGGRGGGSSLRSKLVAYYFPAVDFSSGGFRIWSLVTPWHITTKAQAQKP